MQEQQLILVNENDEQVGAMEKMQTHEKGLLHRAFSVFLFDNKGRMLLQQRAFTKYHSGGLWTNACCSHPVNGEETEDAAVRRLQEEMGIVTPLKKLSSFIYKAEFENGLTEYEYDHLYTGEYNGAVIMNKEEVNDYCYIEMAELKQSLKDHPEKYTAWFRIAFPQIENWWQQEYASQKIIL